MEIFRDIINLTVIVACVVLVSCLLIARELFRMLITPLIWVCAIALYVFNKEELVDNILYKYTKYEC